MNSEIQQCITDMRQRRQYLAVLDANNYYTGRQFLNIDPNDDTAGSCTLSIAEMMQGERSVCYSDLKRYATDNECLYTEVLKDVKQAFQNIEQAYNPTTVSINAHQSSQTFKLSSPCDFLPLVPVNPHKIQNLSETTKNFFSTQLNDVFAILDQSVFPRFPVAVAAKIRKTWSEFAELSETPIAGNDLKKINLAELIIQGENNEFYKVMEGAVTLGLIPILLDLLQEANQEIIKFQMFQNECNNLKAQDEHIYINEGLKMYTSARIDISPYIIKQLLLGLLLSYFTNVQFIPQLTELHQLNSLNLLDIQDLTHCETSQRNFRNADFEVFLSVYQDVLFNNIYEDLSYKNIDRGPYKPILNDVKSVLYSKSGIRYKYDFNQRTYILDEDIYVISAPGKGVIGRNIVDQEDDQNGPGDDFSLQEGSQNDNQKFNDDATIDNLQPITINTMQSLYTDDDADIVIRIVKTTQLTSLQQFFHPVYHSSDNGQQISNESLNYNIRLENLRQEYRGHTKIIQTIRKQIMKRHRANKTGNQTNGECQRERKVVQEVENLKRKLLGWKEVWRGRVKWKQQGAGVQRAVDRGLEETEAVVGAIKRQLEGGTGAADGAELQVPLQKPPASFSGVLKQYQVLGFSWLLHMFDSQLNPLLCDQMGLGKTVQVIAYFSALVDRGIYGPFLVVCPNSLLSNWLNELKRFNDNLKTWPYWGSIQQRAPIKAAIQALCSQYQMQQRGVAGNSSDADFGAEIFGERDSTFHVLITSYSLAVLDFKVLSRVPWVSVVLDEGQMIKSSETRRWQVLMRYQTQNKILLSGTPVQNSLDELWSLLHFAMPGVFVSRERFAEWFGGDAQTANLRLTEQQLKRLHNILRPFVLRREKKDVANQLGLKTENIIKCQMTQIQQKMYTEIQKGTSSDVELKDLQNTIMQLRKIINHPQLFGVSLIRAPFYFSGDVYKMVSDLQQSNQNIELDTENDDFELFELGEPMQSLPSSIPVKSIIKIKEKNVNEQELSQIISELHSMYFYDSGCLQRETFLKNNVFPAQYARPSFEYQIPSIFEEIFIENQRQINHQVIIDVFSSLQSLASIYKLSVDQIKTVISILSNFINPVTSTIQGTALNQHRHYLSYLREYFNDMKAQQCVYSYSSVIEQVYQQNIEDKYINNIIKQMSQDYNNYKFRYYIDKALASPPVVFFKQQNNINFNTFSFNLIYNSKIKEANNRIYFGGLEMLLSQSGKLIALDKLLDQILFENNSSHQKQPCLVYCQMTKMLDILEQYLAYKRISYVRLDGGMSVQDRKASVDKFMTDDSVQVFLLSTRAGSLGLNLTRANNVVFYESDWNPTSDQQASDRVHRIGQTRDVQIWKIITKNSVDELILNRAATKEIMQATVLEGQQRDQNGRLIAPQNKKDRQKQLLLQFIGFQ